MTPQEAADLAARTLAAIDVAAAYQPTATTTTDRERVASDLAGLRDHADNGFGLCVFGGSKWQCDDAARYAAGLIRTAALYGVEVPS